MRARRWMAPPAVEYLIAFSIEVDDRLEDQGFVAPEDETVAGTSTSDLSPLRLVGGDLPCALAATTRASMAVRSG